MAIQSASLRPLPPVQLDIKIVSVSMIEMVANGAAPSPTKLGSATGFFYQGGEGKFLITNRHVVVNEREAFYPDTLILKVHTSAQTLTQSREVKIPLYSERSPTWLEHPSLRDQADIVAIDIANYLQSQDFVNFWTPSDLRPSDAILDLGTAVVVMGYPLGFYDAVHNLPIVRSGTIATAYGAHFQGKQIFLIDANLHPGTSGSPVFVPLSTMRRTTQGVGLGVYPTALVGVNSGVFSAGGVSLGLSAVWYSSLVVDIVSGQQRGQVIGP